MQKIGFTEALDSIVASDPRYQRDAYIFLRDALDFTTKQQKKLKGASIKHVAGPELLEGVRQYALREFGPMATERSFPLGGELLRGYWLHGFQSDRGRDFWENR